MNNFFKTASENTGMQKGILTSYQSSANTFMFNMIEVGREINSPLFASVVHKLKQDTIIAFNGLSNFKKEISTYLLDVCPEELRHWEDKFYQLICMQVQPTLSSNIKSLMKRHPELFNFSVRELINETNRYVEHPLQMNNIGWALDACVLFELNKWFYHLLQRCVFVLEKRTDEDVLRIYNQRFEEYKKQKGALQINHLKLSCDRLVENGKMTKAQYNQLYDSIFLEIKDENLRYLVKGHIDNPIDLVHALQLEKYKESTMEQVFCAAIKRDELKRIYEQREEPEELNYNQNRSTFLTECVKDIQAACYSKDGGSLIRGYNEWFYVFRIFEEKKVKGLNNCRNFVEELQKLDIKVMKLPPSAENLYKTKQEFKERFLFPNWVSPDSISNKFPRILELGAATLKAYEKHKHLLG